MRVLVMIQSMVSPAATLISQLPSDLSVAVKRIDAFRAGDAFFVI